MTKTKLRRYIRELVRATVKMRDKFTCKHCKKKVSGKNCHPSHIIPQSADKRLALYSENVKVLCHHCHMHFRHKYPTRSGQRYADNYPDNLAWLENKKLENVKKKTITITEYEQFAKKALAEISEYNYDKGPFSDSVKTKIERSIRHLTLWLEDQ